MEQVDETFEKMDQAIKENKHQLPAKNFHYHTPRCCATCKFFVHAAGFGQCTRPDGPGMDVISLDHYFRVCDRYSKKG